MSKTTPTTKKEFRKRRHARVRARAIGTESRPRLSVFRSSTHIYAQVINDELGATLANADSRSFEKKKPMDAAVEVGKMIATEAKKKGIEKVVFDRGGFEYAGRVKALADSARDNGLIF
ncbi:50S ribosomal protein L18 [Candidatus Kaiserbacteria bacterium CG10_big_fil_rev_8_21_14_0_10_45_20]|uniref:Large ribosomal subunit protein uL18 n=1 Tax=Candidatus Kaiserbacteria bacterium CG10_big_fil_rev_8_21_14_0_10_45_20 TaxID=1974607 RepID=A0A2H0UFH6_9BACT|nr:MAG: 50S ribosomal protein L18 [Candidatus Kaiserbacteria bacterium CG10_big_fil_rev_8_21_14_0_10_45_20]